MTTRREMLLSGAAAIGGAALATANPARASQIDTEGKAWEQTYSGDPNHPAQPPAEPGKDYQGVVVPNGGTLPFKIIDGVKVFHLVAEPIEHEFATGLKANCWGYNGRVNSTVIEAVEGDHIRIYVTNKLPVPTTVHWHGIYLPNGMDGVSGLTQHPIPPGQTFRYEWVLRQHGTYMYHSHHDTMTQEGLGLIGMLVIHPRKPSAGYRVDRDFVILLSEWSIEVGTSRPNTLAMSDFNVLTMNGKVFPAIEPLVAKLGDRVRIRFGNLSAMDHHPIHLHGHYWKITATDGGQIPVTAQWPETTVLVPVGSTRDVEFIASDPGDWAMHCHMTHHMMNQMGHNFPNMVGVDPGELDARVQTLLPGYMTMGQHGMEGMGEMSMPMPKNSIAMLGKPGPFSYIDMGGMFTILKVREKLESYADPGWYQHPEGTVASRASAEELKRDGIAVPP
jgi:manganese oxidase